MFKAFFRWLDARKLVKHIWIKMPDANHAEKVHYTSLIINDVICIHLNLINDNPHEGAGWWEKVDVLKTKNFSSEELKRFCTYEKEILKCSDFPRIPEVERTTVYTFLPQEVISDLKKAPGRTIGFKPHKADPDKPCTVVWIHLCKN